jgi:hypothetical protein
VPVHYAGREPGVLDIFFEYSLKIPRIYSNMLEYTQIYSNISLLGGRRGLPGEAGGWSRRAGRRIDNLGHGYESAGSREYRYPPLSPELRELIEGEIFAGDAGEEVETQSSQVLAQTP